LEARGLPATFGRPHSPLEDIAMSFYAAGGSYMTPLLLLGLAGLGLLVHAIIASNGEGARFGADRSLALVRHLALFILVLGILSQAQGLYQALSAVEAAGDISPALLAGGLKVSFIAPIFGFVEFLVLYAGYALVNARS